MRLSLLIAVLMATSPAAVANEAFIPQASSATAMSPDLGGRAVAASTIATPLTPAAFKTMSSAMSAPALPSNVSDITQLGTKNLAVVGQTGGSNQSTVTQTGSGNQAMVTQRR